MAREPVVLNVYDMVSRDSSIFKVYIHVDPLITRSHIK